MLPPLPSSVLALWIFLERLYHLKRADGRGESLFEEARSLFKGDREATARRAREHPEPVAAVFKALLGQPLKEKADPEEVAAIRGGRGPPRLPHRLPLLRLIGDLAPGSDRRARSWVW
jgi:hypothetical protein